MIWSTKLLHLIAILFTILGLILLPCMLLFVISDLVLLIGEKKKINGIWLQVIIWATYVPAEALLLTSLLSTL